MKVYYFEGGERRLDGRIPTSPGFVEWTIELPGISVTLSDHGMVKKLSNDLEVAFSLNKFFYASKNSKFYRGPTDTLTVLESIPILNLNYLESKTLLTKYQESAPPEHFSITVQRLPGLHHVTTHPIQKYNGTVYSIIIDLNDTHHWTRERIADWLETLDLDLRFK